jgi:hypothetical protein
MNVFSQMAQSFFWNPTGVVASLEQLDASHGVTARHDVTAAVGEPNQNHRLTVVELSGGKIIGDLRVVATAGDVAVGNVQRLFGCARPEEHFDLRRRRFRLPKFRRGKALLLGAANSDNYYHWLLDSLPRWKTLQVAGELDYDFVLLHRRSAGFQDEALDRLKVPPAKRLRCSKNFVHQFERLVVPAMPFPVEEIPAWTCAWLRSLFPEKIFGPKKIYLSRRGAGGRQLVNEAELLAGLEARGFVALQPEQLSVAEQARRMSSARCVVAPHGAALTNLVFAPPGALLLELFHPEHKNRVFVNLAKVCGHRYASLDGYATNDIGERQLKYVVDVSTVLQLVAGEN